MDTSLSQSKTQMVSRKTTVLVVMEHQREVLPKCSFAEDITATKGPKVIATPQRE
jgi:hypothetical protein